MFFVLFFPQLADIQTCSENSSVENLIYVSRMNPFLFTLRYIEWSSQGVVGTGECVKDLGSALRTNGNLGLRKKNIGKVTISGRDSFPHFWNRKA